jgi:hypothetical protein
MRLIRWVLAQASRSRSLFSVHGDAVRQVPGVASAPRREATSFYPHELAVEPV